MSRVVIDYEDFLNADFAQTGKAMLYRSPRKVTIDDNGHPLLWELKYSTLQVTQCESPEESVFYYTPIAQGFTAFADKYRLYSVGSLRMLLQKGKRPNTEELFNIYLDFALKTPRRINDGELRPLKGAALEIQLLKDLINAENKNLLSSQKYYDEQCVSEDTNYINTKLEVKKYALRYIEWVQERHSDLNEQCTTDPNTETKEQDARRILHNSFINSSEDHFNSLIENILSVKKPEYNPILFPDVTHEELYRALGKLIKLKIAKRRHLAAVISESCKIEYDAVYSHI